MGAYVTFEFREPIEFVKSISFLDTNIYGPQVSLTSAAGRWSGVLSVPLTGDNGFNLLEFPHYMYKNVAHIEISIALGSINSLEYRYCAKTPRTAVSIKKYAGPPSLCTASDVTSMQDDVHTLPATNTTWAYCYVISVPSNSDECLYDVTLTDPAPIGGTGGMNNVTKIDETLCKGQTVYVPGVNRTGLAVQEGPFEATLQAYGYYSGTLVSSQDGATVKL